jgi:hypothetical protein
MNYLLRALDKDGKEFFYTGRAGDGWVSPKVSEAFTYQNLDGARSKAKRFNEMTDIHGLRFMAMVPE